MAKRKKKSMKYFLVLKRGTKYLRHEKIGASGEDMSSWRLAAYNTDTFIKSQGVSLVSE